jgi:hypothetical protein
MVMAKAGASPPLTGAEPWQLLDTANDREQLILPAGALALIEAIPAELRRRDSPSAAATKPGLRVRFVGGEGTGKTLAARTLGTKLGRSVFDVDLAALLPEDRRVAQQLIARLFAQAASADAVLYFSWSHHRLSTRARPPDHYERRIAIVVTGLLDRAESYPGLVIFADGDMDRAGEAPGERFDFEIGFPFPGRAERLGIWRALLPHDARLSASALDGLASSFELSGAAIHDCCVAAAADARRDGTPVEMSHIERALEQQQRGPFVSEPTFEAPRAHRTGPRPAVRPRRRSVALQLSATVVAAGLGFLIAHSTGPSAALGAAAKHAPAAVRPPPSQSYASALNAVIGRLNAPRSSAGHRLRDARTARAQAAAAAELASAHSAAASALTRLRPGPAASGANAALAAALRSTGDAYGALARAAAHGDAHGYSAAAAALAHLMTALNTAYSELSRLGFRIG